MNDEKGKAMKISDERREVAARLRVKQEECDTRLYPWTTDDIISALGYTYDFEVDNNLLARLADLIDPTCHVIGTTSQDWSDGSTVYTHELSCGHTCRTDWPEPPAFCDECGARVVSE